MIGLGKVRDVSSSRRWEIVDRPKYLPPVTWHHLLVGVLCVHRLRLHAGLPTTFTQEVVEINSGQDEDGSVF